MSDPYLAEIRIWGCNYAPYGWAFCEGQTLAVQQNNALFSLLGVSFGGDGKTNFKLPDLRGRAPLGVGAGPGLTARTLGIQVGTTSETLSMNNIPQHTHAVKVCNSVGSDQAPVSKVLAQGGIPSGHTVTPWNSYVAGTPNVAMSASAITAVGNGAAHSNMQPFLSMNFCMALMGLYPTRG
jgi:microcystin-dependent protein